MKRTQLLALASIVVLLLPSPATAQDDIETGIEVDFMSHYLWRGTKKGSITMQPMARISWQGASVGILGSTGARAEDPEEIDLSVGYKWKAFNVGLTDYWQTGLDYDGRDLYFYYDQHRSGHRLEANIGYTHELFSVQAYTMVLGNDFKYTSLLDQLDRTGGKRAFSTYAEVRVPFYFGGLDWDVTAGFTPFAGANSLEQIGQVSGYPLLQKNYFYANGPACVLASVRLTKNYELGDVKVPFFAELHTNPYMRKAYFMVGLRVIPFK